MRSCNHALGEKMAGRFGWAVREWFKYKNKLGDRMIKQLSNSVIAKYCDLSVASRSIICRSRRLRQIIDLLATDKSQYFAQPRPIIVKYWAWPVIVLITSLPNNTKSHPVHWDGLYAAVKLNTSSCFCSIFHYTNITCTQTKQQFIKLITIICCCLGTVNQNHCQEICHKTCKHCSSFCQCFNFIDTRSFKQLSLTSNNKRQCQCHYLYKDPVKFALSVK